MRTFLTGVAVVGFFVLVNVIAAGAWAILGNALTRHDIDSPWAGLAVGLASIAAGLWAAKVIIEWPRRSRGRARE